jgi:mannose-6-phosphate isomerase
MKSSQTILKLLSNRVFRSYKGGRLIEQWQGSKNAVDNDKPEEWLASVVNARNENYEPDEGLSKVIMANGKVEKLIDLIEGFLGKQHVAKYGASTAMLTKILDAATRLSIQVHPTKAYSRQYFDAEYGKAEAWYIMSGREIDGERPYVLLGFKQGITRTKWKRYFEEQDIDGMINALHKFYVQPGDVFFIEGGLPHAIGGGCFLIEIQEPTDYTMRVERKTFDGNSIPDILCHQGVGFEAMLDCFIYNGLSEDETLAKYAKQQKIVLRHDNEVIDLITEKDTLCFTMKKLRIRNSFNLNDKSFKTLIVLRGMGTFLYDSVSIPVKQGESYFIPAYIRGFYIENTGITILEILICYPPKQ